jgi:pentatricopeptide repeat protein
VRAAALGKVGMWEAALSLFYEMQEKGVIMKHRSYTTLLKALKTAGRLDDAEAFFGACVCVCVRARLPRIS